MPLKSIFIVRYRNEVDIDGSDIMDANTVSNPGPTLLDVPGDEEDDTLGHDSQELTAEAVYVKYPCHRHSVFLVDII